jgi:hypothetical protein
VDQPEFAGMPEAPKPRRHSAAWYNAEWERYKQLSREHRGLTTPVFGGIILGVSRSRVHQLVNEGRLTAHDIMDRKWLQVDEVEAFSELERSCAYRYGSAAVAA